jgi:hypothetical protein
MLASTAIGGTGLTHSWSPTAGLSCASCQAPIFTPTATGNYTFTLTVSNNNGCSNSSEITICVLGDPYVPGTNGKKVYICHYPQNKPGDPETLVVPVNAVKNHIPGHTGDHIGRCDQVCSPPGDGGVPAPTGEMFTVENAVYQTIIFPNPFGNELSVTVESPSESPVMIELYDLTGRLVESFPGVEPHATTKAGASLKPGIYMLRVSQDEQVQTMKIVKSR